VGIVAGTPPLVSGSDRTSVVVPGKPAFGDEDSADDKTITPDYFRVFGVPLVAGRFFADSDAVPGAPPVVILNDVAAARYFDGASPIGADIRIGLTSAVTYRVVGAVRSVRLLGPEGELHPEMYRPLDWRQPIGSPVITLVMRASRDPGMLAGSVRSAIQSVAPNLVFPDTETYDTLFVR